VAATVIDRRPLWKSRKSSSKITPKEPSPKQQNAPSSEKARIKSKSGASTPTLKDQHVSKGQPPLKSCLKKPSDGSQKSILSSPPLSHRSEFTQMSLRSDYTTEFDNSLSASLFQDQDTEGGEAIKNAPENDEEPVPLESSAGFYGRQEFPVSFVEAFSRNEEAVADSPHMGPYLLKLAKSYASGENPVKALEYCIRAVKFYEKHARRENALELVISLHILASLHCHLGQYEDAVALLERSLTIPDLENGGEDHALAAFSGRMQLGDTLNMVGKLTPSLQAYHQALEIQKSVLGEFDPRVSEICNYIAEAHVQVR
jgi:tetratricopeptide (TPR) repeat protein